MKKLKKGLKEIWYLFGALFFGFYKLATPAKDKSHHWLAGIYILLISSLFFGVDIEGSTYSFLVVVLFAFGKEFIHDKRFGRGEFEWMDIVYTIFGGVSILFFRLIQYEIGTYTF